MDNWAEYLVGAISKRDARAVALFRDQAGGATRIISIKIQRLERPPMRSTMAWPNFCAPCAIPHRAIKQRERMSS
jgi:hypothetical protein